MATDQDMERTVDQSALDSELDALLQPSFEPYATTGNINPDAMQGQPDGPPIAAPEPVQTVEPITVDQSSPTLQAAQEDGVLDNIFNEQQVRDRTKAIREQTQKNYLEKSALGTSLTITPEEKQKQILERQKAIKEGTLDAQKVTEMLASQTLAERIFNAPASAIVGWLNDERISSMVREQEKLDAAKANPDQPMQSWLRDKGERLTQGVIGTAAMVLDGVGWGASIAGRPFGWDDKIDGNVINAYADRIRAKAEQLFPGDPVRQEDFSAQAAQGIGSIFGFYGVKGGATVVGKMLKYSEPALEALQWRMITTAGVLVGMSQQGDQINAARMSGRKVNDVQAFFSLLGGGVLGGTEAIPMMMDIPGLDNITKNMLAQKMIQEFADEAVQEGPIQQFGSNMINKMLVDPTQNPLEGVVSSTIIGGMGGASSAGAGHLAMMVRGKGGGVRTPSVTTPQGETSSSAVGGAPEPKAGKKGEPFVVNLDMAGQNKGMPAPPAPGGEKIAASAARPEFSPSAAPIDGSMPVPVPTFEDWKAAIPVDENGDTDYELAYDVTEKYTGKRFFNQLNDAEKELAVRALAVENGMADPSILATPVTATSTAPTQNGTPVSNVAPAPQAESGGQINPPQGGSQLAPNLPTQAAATAITPQDVETYAKASGMKPAQAQDTLAKLQTYADERGMQFYIQNGDVVIKDRSGKEFAASGNVNTMDVAESAADDSKIYQPGERLDMELADAGLDTRNQAQVDQDLAGMGDLFDPNVMQAAQAYNAKTPAAEWPTQTIVAGQKAGLVRVDPEGVPRRSPIAEAETEAPDTSRVTDGRRDEIHTIARDAAGPLRPARFGETHADGDPVQIRVLVDALNEIPTEVLKKEFSDVARLARARNREQVVARIAQGLMAYELANEDQDYRLSNSARDLIDQTVEDAFKNRPIAQTLVTQKIETIAGAVVDEVMRVAKHFDGDAVELLKEGGETALRDALGSLGLEDLRALAAIQGLDLPQMGASLETVLETVMKSAAERLDKANGVHAPEKTIDEIVDDAGKAVPYQMTQEGKEARYVSRWISAGSTRSEQELRAEYRQKTGTENASDEIDIDAPNFGMPPMPQTLPEGHPLLVEHDTDMSPERVAMREKLIEQRFEGKSPVPEGEKPIAYMLGGGGASGKGTVLDRLKEAGLVTGKYVEIDPDSFKTGNKDNGWDGIPEYWEIDAAGDSRGASVTHEESSMTSKMAQRRAIEGRYHVVIDQTMGTKSKGLEWMKLLKEAGYEIRLVGVTVDAETALRRNIERAKKTKRLVRFDALLSAHKGFSEGFESYAELADVADLYDTNVLEGENHVLLATKKPGGRLEIANKDLYISFVRKVNLDPEADTIRQLRDSINRGRTDQGLAEGSKGDYSGAMGRVTQAGGGKAAPSGRQDGSGLPRERLSEKGPVTPALGVSDDLSTDDTPATLIDKMITASGRSVSAKARQFAVALEEIGTDGRLFDGLKGKLNKLLKSDLAEIASLYGVDQGKVFAKGGKVKPTKAQLVDLIEDRFILKRQSESDAAVLSDYKAVLTRDREDHANDRRSATRNRRLRESAGAVSEGILPEGLRPDGEGGDAGGASEGYRGGSGASGPANDGGYAGQDTGAGRAVSGPGEGTGGDSGAGQRSGDARRYSSPAAVEAAQKADAEREARRRKNYQITEDDKIGSGGPKAKIHGNIAAIKLIRTLEEDGRAATDEEKKVLVKYVGWGQFAQDVFATHKSEWAKERQQLADLLTAEEYAAASASTLNAHYTSKDVIDGMWQALDHFGFKGGRVLEPAAGVGHFIGLMPQKMAARSDWSAVELDKITGAIAKQLYQGSDVRVQGFEAVNFPDNYFDLAISNVPFGSFELSDRERKGFLIHDYFFLKSLAKVRPGGMVAFITSAGTMDKASARARTAIQRYGDLVGAVRLPGGNQGAFKANAGTDVTTDVIFIRKRADGEQSISPAWSETKEIKTPEGPTRINEYFAANPDMMLGKMRLVGSRYRAGTPELIGPTNDIGAKISQIVADKLPADVITPRTKASEIAKSEPNALADAGVKEGAYFLKGGKLFQNIAGEAVPDSASGKTLKRMRGLIEMRNLVNDILSTQLGAGTRDQLPHLRDKLNKAYDSFVAAFGPINKTVVSKTVRKDGKEIITKRYPNLQTFDSDPDAMKTAAIEVYSEDTGKAVKAAIFTQDIVAAYQRPEIAGPADAIAVSLNETGGVDMKLVADMLKVSEPEAIAAVGERAYLNPNGEAWEISALYLSGDVVTKLDEARAAAQTDERYQRNVTALEAVQPEALTSTDIRTSFGSPWIPAEVYNTFMSQVLNMSRADIKYEELSSRWVFKNGNPYAPLSAQDAYGTARAELPELVLAALNSKPYKVFDKHEDGSRTLNADATDEAQAKMRLIQETFSGDPNAGVPGWVWEDGDRASQLEAIYNKRFNRLVRTEFDGSHLELPGLSKTLTLPNGKVVPLDRSPHRVNAVWRAILTGNMLMDHAVGSGKTISAIAAAMEQKRLGLIQRPMFVVPNHMLEQFSREFLEAYPNAKILTADKKNMEAKNRRAFAAKIAADSWDGIIIRHSDFGRISMRDEAYAEFIKEEMDELLDAWLAAKANANEHADIKEFEAIGEEGNKKKSKDPTIKEIERKKKQLQEKLKKLLNKESKDTGATFEELGVDYLVVDESHAFKNLDYSTQHAAVKGLGVKGSQRATDLFVKIRHLEKSRPGRAALFMTGTPMSRSMAEIYTIQRYLQADKLKEYGIDRFDTWAATFGRIQTRTEQGVNMKLKDVASFSKFINVPELQQLYSLIADSMTAEQLNLPRPDLKGGQPQVVISQMGEAEEAATQSLIKQIEDLKGPAEKGKDNHLSLFTKTLQVATDLRLLDPSAPFNPNGKIAKLAANVSEIYKNGKDPALGQIIFLDMGVPNSKAAAKKVETDEDEVIDLEEESDKEVDGLLAGKFNLYQDIKDRLIAQGIPAKEIAFIHDAKTDTAKAAMFKAMREGKIRVLMGTSAKMGVGTNVQSKLIAMHHVDAPWNPADVVQRDGRILRQGNQNKEVSIYRYVTEKSADAYRWQILARKAEFEAQFRAGARGLREADDIDSPIPEAATLRALATGDPRIMEHAELTRELRELDAAKRGHERSHINAKRSLGEMTAELGRLKELEARYEQDAALVTDTRGDNFKMRLDIPGLVGEVKNRKKAGEAIRAHIIAKLQYRWGSGFDAIPLGSISGFKVVARIGKTANGLVYSPVLEGAGFYGDVGLKIITGETDPVGLVRTFENVLNGVIGLNNQNKANIGAIEKDIPRLEKQAQPTPFPKAVELAEKKARHEQLERELKDVAAKSDKQDQPQIEDVTDVGHDLAALIPQGTSVGGVRQAGLDDGKPFVGEKEKLYQENMRAYNLRKAVIEEIKDEQSRIARGRLRVYSQGGKVTDWVNGAPASNEDGAGRAKVGKKLHDDIAFRAAAIEAFLSEEMRPEAIEARAVAQGWGRTGYHGTKSNIGVPNAFIQGSDFGFHASLDDAAGANAALGYPTLKDKMYQAFGRIFKGLEPRTIKQNDGRIIPLRFRFSNPLRLPDIANMDGAQWANPGAMEAMLSSPQADVPESLRRWVVQWNRANGVGLGIPGHDVIIETNHVFSKAFAQELERLGYDAVIYKNMVEARGTDSVFVWDPTRVRSAYDFFHPDASGAEGLSPSDEYVERDLTNRLEALMREEGMDSGRDMYSFDDLNMSPEARKARAEKMGFDTSRVWYHGTPVWEKDGFKFGDVKKFDRNFVRRVFNRKTMDAIGTWFSDRPDGANLYAGKEGAVYPVYLRIENPWKPSSFDEFLDLFNDAQGRARNEKPRGIGEADPLRDNLRALGYDGIYFPPGMINDGKEQGVMVALDPSNIRSINAAFDPSQEGSSNILAALQSDNLNEPWQRATEDPSSAFFTTAFTAADGESITSTEAYEKYVTWAEDNKLPPMDVTAFNRAMAAHGFEKQRIAGRVRYVGIKGNLRLTPEAQAAMPEVVESLEARLKTMLPPDVAVRFTQQIFANGNAAFGRFRPDIRVIELALQDGPEVAIQKGAHEVVHVLREAGAFEDSEWASLVARANKIGAEGGALSESMVVQYQDFYRAQTKGMPEKLANAFVSRRIEEEKVARLAELHFAPKPSRFGATIDALIDRMRGILDAIVGAFNGVGLTSPESVFRRMEKGQIAKRLEVKRAEPDVKALPTAEQALAKNLWSETATLSGGRAFKIPGYDGRVLSKEGADGLKQRVYVVSKDGAEIARVAVMERPVDQWEATSINFNRQAKIKGVSGDILDAIEADTGAPLRIQGIVTPERYRAAVQANPDAVRFHISTGPEFDGLYIPAQSISDMRNAARDAGSDAGLKTSMAARKLEPYIPDAKFMADKANDNMAALRPRPTHMQVLGNNTNTQIEAVEKGLSDLITMTLEAVRGEARLGRLDPSMKRRMGALGLKVWGQFSNRTGIIRLDRANDFPTLVHEVGHHLEEHAELGRAIDVIKSTYQAELLPLASPGQDQLSEGWAQFTRMYLTDPQGAAQRAPGTVRAFRQILELEAPEMLLAFDTIAAAYQRLVAAGPASAVMSRVKSAKEPTGNIEKLKADVKDKGWVGTFTDWWYETVKGMMDNKHPIRVFRDLALEYAANNLRRNGDLTTNERLFLKAANDPYKISRMSEHARVHADSILRNGVTFKGQTLASGPSLQAVLQTAFGGSSKEAWNEDIAIRFGAYLVSRRMNAEWDRFDMGELEGQPDDMLSRKAWAAAQNDFEAAHPEFRQAAKLFDQFTLNVLRWKRENGFISQDQYMEYAAREGYAPLNRIMDKGGATSSRGRSTKRKVMYQFRGSTRDFVNPIESVMIDVYDMSRRTAINDVIRTLIGLAEAAGPMGGTLAERIPRTDMRAKELDLSSTMERLQKETESLIANAVANGEISPWDANRLQDGLDVMFDEATSKVLFSAVETNARHGEKIVYLYEDGKRIPVLLGSDELGTDIFNIIAGVGNQVLDDPFFKGMVATTRMFRAGTTKSPVYIATNWFRDQLSTWALSRDFTPFWTGLKGFKLIKEGGDMVQMYQHYAGMMGGVDSTIIDTMGHGKDVLQLRKSGFTAAPTKFQSFLRTMEISEFASRVGHFEAAYKRSLADGLSEEEAAMEAAYIAHDVMDFSRSGDRMAAAARIVAFLNAAVQALSSTRRTLVGERDRMVDIRDVVTPYIRATNGTPLSAGERENFSTSFRIYVKLVAIGLFGLALKALYHDDDEIDEQTKAQLGHTHWYFRANGHLYRVPKPFELAIFSNLFEAAYDRYAKNDPLAWQRFVQSLRETVLPPMQMQTWEPVQFITHGMTGALDSVTGPMQYGGTGSDLPAHLEGLYPELQFDGYTSELSKLLGKTLGFSPYKTDKMIRTLGSSIGRDALSFSDIALPWLNRQTGGALPGVSMERAEKSVEDMMFVSRFMRRAARGAYSSYNFWQDMGRDSGRLALAAQSFKKEMDTYKSPRDAMAMLMRMEPEERAFTILDYYYKEKDQDLHPMNRALQVVSAATKIRKQVLLDTLYQASTEKKTYIEPQKIELDGAQKKAVNEILEDIAMREARNAQIVLGKPGWAGMKELPVDGLLAELKAVAPQVADEYEYRLSHGNTKVYSYEGIKKVWPQVRERLLRDEFGTSLADLRAQAQYAD